MWHTNQENESQFILMVLMLPVMQYELARILSNIQLTWMSYDCWYG
ncbi:MAG TPA: hypothetical protein VGQ41_27520 [Pyrinomonadaceae bacterium]|nr:hypothetical protein [Pyrinomonadaceae bacterium]